MTEKTISITCFNNYFEDIGAVDNNGNGLVDFGEIFDAPNDQIDITKPLNRFWSIQAHYKLSEDMECGLAPFYPNILPRFTGYIFGDRLRFKSEAGQVRRLGFECIDMRVQRKEDEMIFEPAKTSHDGIPIKYCYDSGHTYIVPENIQNDAKKVEVMFKGVSYLFGSRYTIISSHDGLDSLRPVSTDNGVLFLGGKPESSPSLQSYNEARRKYDAFFKKNSEYVNSVSEMSSRKILPNDLKNKSSMKLPKQILDNINDRSFMVGECSTSTIALLNDFFDSGLKDARIILFTPKSFSGHLAHRSQIGMAEGDYFHMAILWNGCVYGSGEVENGLPLQKYVDLVFKDPSTIEMEIIDSSSSPKLKK